MLSSARELLLYDQMIKVHTILYCASILKHNKQMIAYLRKYQLKLVCRVHKCNGADDLNSITLLRRAVVCVSRALVLLHFSECIYKMHIKKFGHFGVENQYDTHTVLPLCSTTCQNVLCIKLANMADVFGLILTSSSLKQFKLY